MSVHAALHVLWQGSWKIRLQQPRAQRREILRQHQRRRHERSWRDFRGDALANSDMRTGPVLRLVRR
jgi:hypothetical protein